VWERNEGVGIARMGTLELAMRKEQHHTQQNRHTTEPQKKRAPD